MILAEKMTIRDALEQHYHKDELRKGSLRTLRASCRAWEKHTDNPPVELITNATLEKFRQTALAAGLAPFTVNRYWTSLRSILRRVGPVTDRNPWALDLFPGWRVPAMRLCRVEFKRPKRLTEDELNKLYMAAGHMRLPTRKISDPPAWWRALLVFAYGTALRSADIFKARWSDIDFQNQTIFVKIEKTGVEADLPLHPVVLAHLERLPMDSGRIFSLKRDYLYNQLMGPFREQAGVDFGWHDIRRTACSEIDAADRGMGKVLLLHAPGNVTERSYLNALPDLQSAVEKMKWPLAFRHGVKMVVRAIREAQQQMIKADQFAVPIHPPAACFEFHTAVIVFRGQKVPLRPALVSLLRALVEDACLAKKETLWQAISDVPMPQRWEDQAPLRKHLSRLRAALRKYLPLPRGYNPIVGRTLTSVGAEQNPITHYELLLPPALWQDK